MYWYLNKKTGEPAICGSLVALSKLTLIKSDKLNYHFSAKKLTEYEDENHRIVKCKLIQSKQKHSKTK